MLDEGRPAAAGRRGAWGRLGIDLGGAAACASCAGGLGAEAASLRTGIIAGVVGGWRPEHSEAVVVAPDAGLQ